MKNLSELQKLNCEKPRGGNFMHEWLYIPADAIKPSMGDTIM
jgi:hypothetical protein